MAYDGCEQEVGSDRRNCGACGMVCSAGSFCEAGACVAERADAMPAPRPIAPISHLVTSGVRPAFRWELPDWRIATGARLELCADRACDRRLQTVDATGVEAVPPADLPAGIVFWRLTSRAAGELGRRVSPTWLLYVEPGNCPLSPFLVRPSDYDGDGLPDPHVVMDRDLTIFYSRGIPNTTMRTPADRGGPSYPYFNYSLVGGAGVGDVSGDGYCDFVHLLGVMTATVGGRNYRADLNMHPGGSTGLSAERRSNWGALYSEGNRYPEVEVHAVGDIDRDGYGDFFVRQPDSYLDAGDGHFVRHGPIWPFPYEIFGREDWHVMADFNGDQVVDLLVLTAARTGIPASAFWTLGDAALGRFGGSRTVPGCPALDMAPEERSVIGVGDVNCDGLSDLVVRHRGTGFALLGGSDGLSSSRCMALPAAP